MTTLNKNDMSNNAAIASIILGTTLVVGTLSSLGWYYYFTRDNDTQRTEERRAHIQPKQGSYNNKRDSISNISAASSLSLIKPPFPQTLRELLSKCRLAYLSTVDREATSSHLSLMRFTYVHDPDDGEVVIMSTNRKTKKFDMLSRQTGVALLIHNAASNDDDNETNTDTLSITLNGSCRILAGADETKYRAAHLNHNPDYPQFIVGEDIAVLCVHVTSARICDINDKVTKWNVEEAVALAVAETTKPEVVAQTVRV